MNLSSFKKEDYIPIGRGFFQLMCFIAESLGFDPKKRKARFHKEQDYHSNIWKSFIQKSPKDKTLKYLWQRFLFFQDAFQPTVSYWCNG